MRRRSGTAGDNPEGAGTRDRTLEDQVNARELVHGLSIAYLGAALVVLMSFQSWLLWRGETRDEHRQQTIESLRNTVDTQNDRLKADDEFLNTVRQLIILGPNGDAEVRKRLLDDLREQQARREAQDATSPTTTPPTAKPQRSTTTTTRRQPSQQSPPTAAPPSSPPPSSSPTTASSPPPPAPPPPTPVVTVPQVTVPCVPINKTC